MASSARNSAIQSSGAEKVGEASADFARTSAVVDVVGHRLIEAGENDGSLYARALNQGRDLLNDLPASLSDVSAASERLVLQGRRRLDRRVRKQPAEALLLAGAIGYLVGWAASRG